MIIAMAKGGNTVIYEYLLSSNYFMENSGAAWYPARSAVLKLALGEDCALWSWSTWSYFWAVQAQMSKLCEGKWRISVIPRAYNFL